MHRTADNTVLAPAQLSSPANSLLMQGLRGAGLAITGSLFIAACAHISIPLWFTPVPLTMQPFAVILLGLLLSPRVAFAATAAYLAEGAVGLPVFTPSGLGGLAQLLGPTAGYLFSYPAVAPLVSKLYRTGSRTFTRGLIAAALGNLVILTLGFSWLAFATHASIAALLTTAVLPFLPGDALKVTAAAGIAAGFARWKQR
ncbi:MAG TPA: biotin transporter BioY [Acidobacteriaceae bacterium]